MTRRRAYLLALCILAVISLLTIFAYQNVDIRKVLPAETAQPGYYKVIEVYDGDTIGVAMNGITERVRMIGVDTPETRKPNTPVQCYGPEASQFTKQLLSGQSVRLEADPTNSNRDRYERLLRYVYTEDGMLVSQMLIEEGYGFAYLSFPFEKADAFAASQLAAETASRGLWATCQPILKNGRWQSES